MDIATLFNIYSLAAKYTPTPKLFIYNWERLLSSAFIVISYFCTTYFWCGGKHSPSGKLPLPALLLPEREKHIRPRL